MKVTNYWRPKPLKNSSASLKCWLIFSKYRLVLDTRDGIFCSCKYLSVAFPVYKSADLYVLLRETFPFKFWFAICPKYGSQTVCLHKGVVPSDGNGHANTLMLFRALLLNACSKMAEVNGKWHQGFLDRLCLCLTQKSTILHVADCISSAEVGVKQRYNHL